MPLGQWLRFVNGQRRHESSARRRRLPTKTRRRDAGIPLEKREYFGVAPDRGVPPGSPIDQCRSQMN